MCAYGIVQIKSILYVAYAGSMNSYMLLPTDLEKNSYCGLWEWDDVNLPLLSHLTQSTGSHSLLALKHGHRSVPQVLFTVVFPLSS